MHESLEEDEAEDGSDEDEGDLLVLQVSRGVRLGQHVQHRFPQQRPAREGKEDLDDDGVEFLGYEPAAAQQQEGGHEADQRHETPRQHPIEEQVLLAPAHRLLRLVGRSGCAAHRQQ